jgi:hypothetical protein
LAVHVAEARAMTDLAVPLAEVFPRLRMLCSMSLSAVSGPSYVPVERRRA